MLAGLTAAGVANSDPYQGMVESAMPSVRFLASAVMTVSATTLALMLTLLGLSTDIDGDIKSGHFERVRQIALADAYFFVLATALLVMVVVPAGDASPVPGPWFTWVYYVISTSSAVLGGCLIAVMLLLYAAIRDLILVLSPSEKNPLLDEETKEGSDDSDADEEGDDATADEDTAPEDAEAELA